jgi:methyltransferase, FkbM family
MKAAMLADLVKKRLRPMLRAVGFGHAYACVFRSRDFARETALHLRTRRTGLERTINGSRFQVDSRTRFSFPPVHDPEVVEAYARTLVAGDTCWNIDANVGEHVLQMARIVGPTGRVLAFEPNPEAAALLTTNIQLNRYSDRVSIVEIAIGQYLGTTDFYIAGANPMGRAQQPNSLLQRTRRITVPLKTIDSVLEDTQSLPNCVLVDIEGWEIAALLGAPRLLAAEPFPMLIIELHPDAWAWSGHSRHDLEALLKRYSLYIAPLSGQHDPLSQYGQVIITR